MQANIAVPPPPPAPPGIDLERAALARSDRDICAEWVVEAPVRPGTAFIVYLRAAGEGDSGALVRASALIPLIGEGDVRLGYPGADGVADGDVSVDGRHVSMRFSRSEIPEWLPLDRFEWEAETLAGVAGRGAQYSDCAPQDGGHIAYPGGELVSVESGIC